MGKNAVALGELLIDFTDGGQSKQGNPIMEANPGGAPCNVLSMMNKLGDRTTFIGKVGNDFLGTFLKGRLDEMGINTEHLYFDDSVSTTLAFVHNKEDGDREFSFYRNPGADVKLRMDEVPCDAIGKADLFHFGTLSMTHEDARRATIRAVETAKNFGVPISFDPNLRVNLWSNQANAKEAFTFGMERCDILKISDNELLWYTGEEDIDKAVDVIRNRFDIKLVTASMGPDGSRAYYKDIKVSAKPFLTDKTIDTTGAGDTFGACVFHFAIEYGLDNLDEEKLAYMLKFANAAASIVTTRKGALCVMPEYSEVINYINEREKP